ncbi:MAG TPA: tyrosine-type recombinase/integrase [Anaerolineae bacterium]|nr:tyrosine-type recombinase/integrase [Anaerolineae bacterium]HMR66130.1 tyrosine-type recombinase/integrase [Anaerolineae bacterium]
MSNIVTMLLKRDELILAQFEEALTQAALASSTVVNYLADLRAFLRWGQQEFNSDFSLRQVNQEHVRLYRYHLTQKLKRSPSTVNRHLMALRKFFTFAQEIDLVLFDPMVGVSLVSDSNDTVSGRLLTTEETERLLKAAQKGSRAGLARRDAAILCLLIYTGLRVSEVVDLQTTDLVFDNPGVHLQVGSGPEGQVRHLPLPGEVHKVIYSYLQVRPRVSTSHLFLSQEGRPISSRTVQRIVSDCARAAGFDGISAQTLRRTYAANLMDKTQDLALVSKRLGHQNLHITEHYLASCQR